MFPFNTPAALKEPKSSKEYMSKKKTNAKALGWTKFIVCTVLYLLFLYWVESWWGLLVVPFIFDCFVSHKIKWGWWREPEVSPAVRFIMGWVDAIVFALVAIYFLNQFFFQNFVIPSSSLEKTLLTGDYLLVSKVAYGPRIPQTPLYVPMTQHTVPLLNCQSYTTAVQWDYRRVKGLGKVQLNDIVVFNYPAGDTVALNQQNQDYYRLAYQMGDQILGTPGETPMEPTIPASRAITDDMNFAAQQSLYSKIYAAGTAYMKQNAEEFGDIKARPADRRENYVKRCVGLPGQTLQIRQNKIYLTDANGKTFLNRDAENVQYAYEVTFKTDLPEDLKKEWGVTDEDLYTVRSGNVVVMPLTQAVKKAMQARPDLVEKIKPAQPADEWLYPLNMKKNWTTANYGPVWIPKKGASLKLTTENLPIYERPIRVYEGNQLEVKNGKIFINGKQTDTYTFKMDYYWMMGDNRDNSLDSRFWGFVPEDHVVGKPLFIWISLDPDYGWFNGHVRWNRFFKNAGN